MQRELNLEAVENMPLVTMLTQETPEFIRRVTQQGTYFLKDISCKSAFIRFLEFLYCDKFVRPMTCQELDRVAKILLALKLTRSYLIVKKYQEFAQAKIVARANLEVAEEMQQMSPLLAEQRQGSQIQVHQKKVYAMQEQVSPRK